MAEDEPTVLVVDDEEDVTEVYALWLAERYDVRMATGGREAMIKMDDAVDVLLLDRRMPDMSGDEVLERVRDEGYDVRVGMVTAVDPDFDLVDMPFEAYLTKPVMEPELFDTVEHLIELHQKDETTREKIALEEKRSALEREKDPEELEESDDFEDLNERLEQLGN